jgi:hypothetical protein
VKEGEQVMSDVNLSRSVQDCCQDVLRTALASRDALLFAASARVDEGALRRFCHTLAERLGGQVAELTQLLVAHGCTPVKPDDTGVDRVRGALVSALQPAEPRVAESADEPRPKAKARAAESADEPRPKAKAGVQGARRTVTRRSPEP